jgi:hypothetical protein
MVQPALTRVGGDWTLPLFKITQAGRLRATFLRRRGEFTGIRFNLARPKSDGRGPAAPD